MTFVKRYSLQKKQCDYFKLNFSSLGTFSFEDKLQKQVHIKKEEKKLPPPIFECIMSSYYKHENLFLEIHTWVGLVSKCQQEQGSQEEERGYHLHGSARTRWRKGNILKSLTRSQRDKEKGCSNGQTLYNGKLQQDRHKRPQTPCNLLSR